MWRAFENQGPKVCLQDFMNQITRLCCLTLVLPKSAMNKSWTAVKNFWTPRLKISLNHPPPVCLVFIYPELRVWALAKAIQSILQKKGAVSVCAPLRVSMRVTWVFITRFFNPHIFSHLCSAASQMFSRWSSKKGRFVGKCVRRWGSVMGGRRHCLWQLLLYIQHTLIVVLPFQHILLKSMKFFFRVVDQGWFKSINRCIFYGAGQFAYFWISQ